MVTKIANIYLYFGSIKINSWQWNWNEWLQFFFGKYYWIASEDSISIKNHKNSIQHLNVRSNDHIVNVIHQNCYVVQTIFIQHYWKNLKIKIFLLSFDILMFNNKTLLLIEILLTIVKFIFKEIKTVLLNIKK